MAGNARDEAASERAKQHTALDNRLNKITRSLANPRIKDSDKRRLEAEEAQVRRDLNKLRGA